MRYVFPALFVLFSATAAGAEDAAPALVIGDTEKAVAVAAGNDFASDLYGQLKGEKGNIFFSPESI